MKKLRKIIETKLKCQCHGKKESKARMTDTFPDFSENLFELFVFFVLSNEIVRCLSGKNLGLPNGKFWAGVGNENNVFVC